MNANAIGKTIIFVMLAALFLSGVNASAQSSLDYNDSSPGNDSHGPRGKHMGPPPEAVESCDGLGVSEACSFTSRRGNEITGTCEYLPDDQFACIPEGGPPVAGRTPGDAPLPE